MVLLLKPHLNFYTVVHARAREFNYLDARIWSEQSTCCFATRKAKTNGYTLVYLRLDSRTSCITQLKY